MQADISSAHKELPLFLFMPGTFCQLNTCSKQEENIMTGIFLAFREYISALSEQKQQQ